MSYAAMQFVAECISGLGVSQKVPITGEAIRDIGDMEHDGHTWNGADQVLEGIAGAPFEFGYMFDESEDVYWFYRWPKLPIDGLVRAYVSPDKRERYDYDGRFYHLKKCFRS